MVITASRCPGRRPMIIRFPSALTVFLAATTCFTCIACSSFPYRAYFSLSSEAVPSTITHCRWCDWRRPRSLRRIRRKCIRHDANEVIRTRETLQGYRSLLVLTLNAMLRIVLNVSCVSLISVLCRWLYVGRRDPVRRWKMGGGSALYQARSGRLGYIRRILSGLGSIRCSESRQLFGSRRLPLCGLTSRSCGWL